VAQPAKRFTLVFPVDSATDTTPTVIGLTDTAYSVPSGSTYKYRVEGGADKYNLYEMVYDETSDTVDVLVNGIERIADYPGNSVSSVNSTLASGTIMGVFGSGSSPGVAKTNYGDIQLTIKNPSCVPPVITPPTTPSTQSTIQN
jgi:hypothetical protein